MSVYADAFAHQARKNREKEARKKNIQEKEKYKRKLTGASTREDALGRLIRSPDEVTQNKQNAIKVNSPLIKN